jgi:2-octaprenyl-6-methoxyphenol hydroxylase
MNAQAQHCDIAIIGGGPVGASLALALRDSGLDVRVLEARKPDAAAPDPRALALSYGSSLILDRLGVWQELDGVSAIRNIHISQQHSFGRAQLNASDLKVPELGYVLPYPALHGALHQALSSSHITYLTGASVTQLSFDHVSASAHSSDGTTAQLLPQSAGSASNVSQLHSSTEGTRIVFQHEGSDQTLYAKLAVVADGGKLLEGSNPPEIRDYGQSALISHITCSQPKDRVAFERFTAQGPVALLPYQDGYELVWTASHEASQQMLGWSDTEFLAQLQRHFGDRVGSFQSAGKRSCFPLRLKRAPQTTLPHTVLIGNAAQTLHPVAGQGFNMGLRDAYELAQAILRCAPDALGSPMMLADYDKSRRLDRNAGIRFTDGLVRIFSNDLPLLNAGRAAALSLLDCLPGMKKFVARRMMFGTNG